MAQKAILLVNLHKENAQSTAEEIRGELEGRGTAVTVFAFEGRPGSAPDGAWDIALSLGGDGTVLYAARILAAAATPILPIHLGTLGFLVGVERHEWRAVYEQWEHQTARISSRCMLSLAVERGGQGVYRSACLNDIVVASSGKAKLIRLRVKTEIAPGEYADLGCYRSDGLVIATPTGSTAYSMAAGGPILDPEMEALIVSPVCPFTLSNRPLVLPSRQALLVTVEQEQRSDIVLTVDGQDTFDLEPEDTVTITHSPHYARLITAGRSSYFSALKRKLAWQGAGVSTGGAHA
ncbi:MAG: NAD(+)/NADH kinase [Treponema sp.]|jgi:NAD+ kinase|nr:NAD(+)/NADH kinase [Treponema sp.]